MVHFSSDDEYRLLRQNLFERFAGGAVVPSETPLVPLASASHRSANGRCEFSIFYRQKKYLKSIVVSASVSSSTQGRPSSQFHVNRSPSLRKTTSMSSTVSTIFRRASRRQSSSGLGTNGTGAQSSAASDASSLFSMNSSSSFRRPVLTRALSRKGSNSSIRTQTSRTAYNNSFSSRPGSSTLDPHSFTTPSTSRSTTRSLRRLATATPPSSFTARISGSELGPGEKPVSPTSVHDVFDDQNLRTAKEIRQEIELVEAEGRRLMDAFNGLELSTLTRCRQQPLRLPPLTSPSSDGSRSREGEGPTWSLMPERKRRGADVDALSIRSNTSAGTTLSAAKSQISGARIRTIPGTNKSISLLRKNSLSSLSSRANSSHGLHPVPPLPLSPSSNQSHLGVGSTSSINLSRSSGHLPLSALAESEIVDRRSFTDAGSGLGSGQTDQTDDADIIALEAELADIRKRRGEVTARYETRLEYLRAKLKGAELHEKLLRK